tara:strand:+ start:2902 stop:3285 length:384 start_codon:yes stop_codon:yes gene_type:complete
MEDQIIQAGIDIITPVLESAIVLGGNYAKKSGRDILTGMDLEYALKFCARNVIGKHTGTLFPELQDESDNDSEHSSSSSEEPPFTRYTGDDETLKKVNECYDTWEEWVPLNPTEEMLKKSIDSRQWI